MFLILCLHKLSTSRACNPAYPSTTEVHDDVTGPVDRQHRCSQVLQLLTFSLMTFLWEIYEGIQLSLLFFTSYMYKYIDMLFTYLLEHVSKYVYKLRMF